MHMLLISDVQLTRPEQSAVEHVTHCSAPVFEVQPRQRAKMVENC